MTSYKIISPRNVRIGDRDYYFGEIVEETGDRDFGRLVKLKLIEPTDSKPEPTPKENSSPTNKPLTETENDDTVIPVIKAKGPAWFGVYFKGEQIGKSVRTEAEAEEIKQEYEKNLAQAKDEAGQIVSDARARAKNEYQNKMDQTKEEIALMKENARKDIEAEKQKTIAGLQTEIAGIALMAASKVVEKEANDKGNEKLLDDFLKEAGV